MRRREDMGMRRGRGGGRGWGRLTKGQVRGNEWEGKWEVGSALRADLGAKVQSMED